MTDELIGWHFLAEDRRLQFKPRKLVKPGQTLRVKPPLRLCKHGLHASERALDALRYAPGPVICRVRLSGEILRDKDKACATERTVLWMADGSRILHEFACWCAETALRTSDMGDQRYWKVIKIKRRWLKGKATDEELAAAIDSAVAAAGTAAGTAAMDSARAAVWAAIGNASVDSAMAAALAAENKALEEMLGKLEGCPP